MGLHHLALGSILLVAGCRSLEITPGALREDPDLHPERALALERWTAAVELANEFLTSSYRRTLPPGRYDLDDGGMRFVGEHGELPMRVFSTTWGDWVVRTGFRAQERELGFVVGRRPPVRDELVDNSFLRGSDGELAGASSLARLVLHETTHVLYRDGTVGFWNGVAYYLEAIFLLRSATHSDERSANATSEEFGYFLLEREAEEEYASIYRQAFEEHLAQGPTSRCTHGPVAPDP